jgi:hypothetical protein
VSPGGSIDTGGNNPAHLTLPNTGPGATITLTQRATGNNFCQGPCNGTATFVSDFPGYPDKLHPIDLKLTFLDANPIAGLLDYAFSTIYKVRDDATVGVPVPDCLDNGALRRQEDDQVVGSRKVRGDLRDPVPVRRRRVLEKVTSQPAHASVAIVCAIAPATNASPRKMYDTRRCRYFDSTRYRPWS